MYYGATSKTLPSGLYKGSGGYIYWWNAQTAQIRIVTGPGGSNIDVAPGTSAWSAILAEITRIGKPNVSSAEANAAKAAQTVAASAVSNTAASTMATIQPAQGVAAPFWERSWFPPALVGGLLLAGVAGLMVTRR